MAWWSRIPCQCRRRRDPGLIPRPGRSHRGGNGNSLQYSSLENPMDRGASRAAVHGVAELDTTACVYTHTHTHKHDTRPSVHQRGSHSLFHLLLHWNHPCSALGTHSLIYLEYSPRGWAGGWAHPTGPSVAVSCPLKPE